MRPSSESTMTPTVQEVAEQLVDQLCNVLVGVHPQATGKKLLPIIVEALTTFAHAKERAVWEEVAEGFSRIHSILCGAFDYEANTSVDEAACIAEEFRRRATQAERKEVMDR